MERPPLARPLLPRPPHPGIINGGVVSALFDCHGNWTAAIALMDKAALPKPPLTLTYEMLVRTPRLDGHPPGVPLCTLHAALASSLAPEACWHG